MTIRKGVNMKKEKDVKVVERLEDVSIMEGIDFKYNQKIMRIDERMRKERKETKRKDRIEKTLLTIVLILVIGITIVYAYKVFKGTDQDIENCMSKGYSRQVCEKSILGN